MRILPSIGLKIRLPDDLDPICDVEYYIPKTIGVSFLIEWIFYAMELKINFKLRTKTNRDDRRN